MNKIRAKVFDYLSIFRFFAKFGSRISKKLFKIIPTQEGQEEEEEVIQERVHDIGIPRNPTTIIRHTSVATSEDGCIREGTRAKLQ